MKKSRILKALASLRLAVVIIIVLGTLMAWGTFVEARYGDALPAQKLVYHSKWMYAAMIVFAINLIAVMVDRWPWQKRHTGFVLAHIGIIILLIGSIMTAELGLDGSLRIGVGEKSGWVMTNHTDLAVYATLDGSGMTKIFDREVDFFLNRPTKEKPVVIELPSGRIAITDYFPYAFADEKIVASTDEKSGAAVRFQLQNPNVSVTEWLLQPSTAGRAEKDLGPAQIVLTSTDYVPAPGKNTIVLRKVAGSEDLDYSIHSAREAGKAKTGRVKPGETVETGWMGLVLRVLKVIPQAKQQINFVASETSTPLTTAAIKVEYTMDGKPPLEQWTSINSMLKLFSDQAMYVVYYMNRRTDIGFKLELRDFRVGRYPGTMRAASYESLVDVPGKGEHLISMNEPLKHNGLTFYQASFDEDEQGRPVASILSVNRDPGRWVKYLGSLLIVLGSIHLFYFKSRAAKAKRKTDQEPPNEVVA